MVVNTNEPGTVSSVSGSSITKSDETKSEHGDEKLLQALAEKHELGALDENTHLTSLPENLEPRNLDTDKAQHPSYIEAEGSPYQSGSLSSPQHVRIQILRELQGNAQSVSRF